jgi:hypothetical protein
MGPCGSVSCESRDALAIAELTSVELITLTREIVIASSRMREKLSTRRIGDIGMSGRSISCRPFRSIISSEYALTMGANNAGGDGFEYDVASNGLCVCSYRSPS